VLWILLVAAIGGTKQFVTSQWASRYSSTFKVSLLKPNLFFFSFFFLVF